MSKITRRTLLKQSPAALALAAIPTSAAVAALPAETAPAENPELIAAYDRFLAARAEVAAAEDALEWLVDEWRHLWPLAPEEILGGANADKSSGSYADNAERDIAGRFIQRETVDLTKRLSRKWREKHQRTCFHVETPEQIERVIRGWERPRSGRTAAALARKIAEQQKVLAIYKAKLPVSRAYYAETAALRKASGVEQVKQRIEAAKAEIDRAVRAVSHKAAHTIDGLRIKAEVLLVQDGGMVPHLRDKGGAIGGMSRFVYAVLDVIGRAEA